MSGPFDTTIAALNAALDGSSLRQRTIANNIANVNTPGYKSRSVQFEDQLKAALDSGEDEIEENLSSFSPTITVNTSTTYRTDGNNVDIDSQMTELAENQLYYAAMTRLLSNKLTTLQSVIREGK